MKNYAVIFTNFMQIINILVKSKGKYKTKMDCVELDDMFANELSISIYWVVVHQAFCCITDGGRSSGVLLYNRRWSFIRGSAV